MDDLAIILIIHTLFNKIKPVKKNKVFYMFFKSSTIATSIKSGEGGIRTHDRGNAPILA